MQKYAIYKITRFNREPEWEYGISPNIISGRSGDVIALEISTYTIKERFSSFAVCASTFHAGQRTLKNINKTVDKYIRKQGALLDKAQVDVLTGIQTGKDWPEDPYLESILSRYKTLQMLLTDWEQEEMRRAINQIHARVNATDRGVETESLQELKDKAARLGFIWKG